MIARGGLLALIALAALPVAAQEPDGYRMDHYRAPVPEAAPGAVTVDTDAAYALWRSGRVAFVDVWPRPPRPANLPKGTIWRDPVRRSIPGAIWLPNVGYGALAPITDDYFRRGMETATGGDKDMPVVLFCLSDCWMSWNAARRVQDYGYTRVFWMPEGTDGWEFMDYPTEVVAPQPEPS